MINKLFKYAPVQLFSALSLFVLISIQTRFLTPKEYGLLAILLVFSEGARSVLIQWVNSCLIRFYSTSDADIKPSFQSQTTRWLIYNLLISSVVIAGCMLVFSNFSWANFSAIYALLISKSIYMYLIECARVEERVSLYRRTVFLQAMLVMITSFVILNWHAHILSAIFALVLSYFISIIIAGYSGKFTLKLDKPMRKEVLNYGIPFMVSGLLGILASRSDRVLVATLANLEQAGLYAAIANLLLGIMALVFMIVALPLFPELTKVVDNKDKLYQQHRYYGGVLCALSLPATIGICLLASSFVEVFLGKSYHVMDLKIFYLLAFSAWFLNIRGHFLDHGFQFILKTKWMPLLTFCTLVTQMVLSFILIPQYGALGAAGSLAIAFFIGALCSLCMGTFLGYRYPLPQCLLQTVIASSIMSLSIFCAKYYVAEFIPVVKLLLLVAVGCLSYTGAHIVLNSFSVRGHFNDWRRKRAKC